MGIIFGDMFAYLFYLVWFGFAVFAWLKVKNFRGSGVTDDVVRASSLANVVFEDVQQVHDFLEGYIAVLFAAEEFGEEFLFGAHEDILLNQEIKASFNS